MSADMSPLTRTLHTRSRVLQSFQTANPGIPEQGPNQGTDQSTRTERVLGGLRFITRVPGGVIEEAPFNGYSPTGVTNLEVNFDSQDGGTWIWNVTWTPDPYATSYEVGVDWSGAFITQPTNSSVTVTTPNYDTSPFVVTITAVNAVGRASISATGQGCFLAGAQVSVVGGTKSIEDIIVGDIVIGAFGEENPVLGLHRVVLGDATMYKINGEHDTNHRHPHISVERKFYTPEPSATYEFYGKTYAIMGANGPESRKVDGLKKGRVQKMELSVELKTIDGSRTVNTMEPYSLPFDTPLYNLVVGGSHTYHANGYAVVGWANEEDFDYDMWVPKA